MRILDFVWVFHRLEISELKMTRENNSTCLFPSSSTMVVVLHRDFIMTSLSRTRHHPGHLLQSPPGSLWAPAPSSPHYPRLWLSIARTAASVSWDTEISIYTSTPHTGDITQLESQFCNEIFSVYVLNVLPNLTVVQIFYNMKDRSSLFPTAIDRI